MWVLSFSTSDHLYLTGWTRNLFGHEYCQGRKRVSRKEVKEAFETLIEEKIAVCFQFIFFRNSYSNIFSILSGIRVIHSWHFWSIFATARLGFHFLFIFHSFSFQFWEKMETKWNGKWMKNEWKNANCERPYCLICFSIIWLTVASRQWHGSSPGCGKADPHPDPWR